MMDTLQELKAYFDQLPRPLPKDVKLNNASTIGDLEVFLKTCYNRATSDSEKQKEIALNHLKAVVEVLEKAK